MSKELLQVDVWDLTPGMREHFPPGYYIKASDLGPVLEDWEQRLLHSHDADAIQVCQELRRQRRDLHCEPETQGKDFGTVIIDPIGQRIRLTWDKHGVTIEGAP